MRQRFLSGQPWMFGLAQNPEFHDRTKHIDIQYHWIREVLASRRVEVQFVGMEDKVADMFTEPLSREKLRPKLGMRSVL